MIGKIGEVGIPNVVVDVGVDSNVAIVVRLSIRFRSEIRGKKNERQR